MPVRVPLRNLRHQQQNGRSQCPTGTSTVATEATTMTTIMDTVTRPHYTYTRLPEVVKVGCDAGRERLPQTGHYRPPVAKLVSS